MNTSDDLADLFNSLPTDIAEASQEPDAAPQTTINIPSISTPSALEVLAYDIATGLLSTAEILHKHSVTQHYVDELLKNEGFSAMVVEHRRLWNSPDTGTQRIQVKSRMAQEHVLPALVGIALDESAHASDRIAAAREIRQASDAGDPAGERRLKAAHLKAGAGAGLVLNMHFADGQPQSIDVRPALEPDETLGVDED